MPAERIGMRDAREIIRLKSSSVSTHEIARRLGLARSTVRETLKRVDGAGLSWPLPEDMNDEALEAALYASRRSKRGHRRIEEPDWPCVHRELFALTRGAVRRPASARVQLRSEKSPARGDSNGANSALRAGGREKSALIDMNTGSAPLFRTRWNRYETCVAYNVTR
jgi:DNA-binding transcriptional ArsR family regulator